MRSGSDNRHYKAMHDAGCGTEEERFSKQILRYTVLFLITAVCTYALFIVLPRTFLSNAEGNIDGIAQQYPIYSEIRRMIHALISGQSMECWSWDIGLGDDAFIEFNTKLFNPLTYLVIAFPQKYVDIGFTLMILIMQYLSGLSFMLFGRKIGFDHRQNITGGLCYAFCGWIIQSILRQGTFLMATILFPLLVLGVEKLIRGESPLLLIISVALHVLYSMQWAYVGAITIVAYFAVRIFTAEECSDNGERLELTGRFFCCGLAGVVIPGVVLIDTLSKMWSATTASTVEDPVLYPLSQYLEMPAGFFLTTPVTDAYSVLGMPVICIILLPLAVRGIRQKHAQAIMAMLLFVLSFLPATGKVFNGFSYSVGRWYYVMIFFMIWSAMDCYKPETFREKKNIRIMAVWMTLLMLWGLGVCKGLLGIIDLTKTLTVLIGFLISIPLLIVLSHGALEKGRKYGLLVTAMIIVSIVGYVNTNLFPGLGEQIHTLCQVGRIESDFSDSTQRVGPAVQAEDPDFFRIDQVDGYTDARIARVRANENMYFGNRSIYTYLSTMESSWHDFCKTVGNNAGYFDRTTVYSNDNREGLDLLMGVKYFLGDSTTKKPGANEYAAYGYSPYKEIDGVQVLQNKYCIGLGTAYGQYITESELMEFTPLEREQVMLQAAVLPDDTGENLQVAHADLSGIKTDVRPVNVRVSGFENIDAETDEEANGGTLTVHHKKGKGGSFDIELPEIKDARVVIAFEGFVRDKSDYDTDLALKGKTFKGNALSHKVKAASYTDNEKFKLELSRGDLVKAAQMRKGKNQGYRDVKDFYVNLGYFENVSGKVHVDIDRTGVYHFDAIRAYVVPVEIYDEAAPELEASSLKTESFDGREVKGTVTADKDSVLYLSVLNQPGWKALVDGAPVRIIDDVNIAFTGVPVSAGTHSIELIYRTPYVIPGLCLTAAGLIAMVILAIVFRKKIK